MTRTGDGRTPSAAAAAGAAGAPALAVEKVASAAAESVKSVLLKSVRRESAAEARRANVMASLSINGK